MVSKKKINSSEVMVDISKSTQNFSWDQFFSCSLGDLGPRKVFQYAIKLSWDSFAPLDQYVKMHVKP